MAPIGGAGTGKSHVDRARSLALVSCSLGTKPWLTNLAGSAAAAICSVVQRLAEIALVVAPTFPSKLVKSDQAMELFGPPRGL